MGNESKRRRVRSIFISDVHLGCRHSQADMLLSFLKQHSCEYLYLVGDIIDGWKMRRGFSWNDTNTLLVRRVFGMVKHGTTVRYVAGNHDEFLRNYMDEFQTALTGHIEIANEFIHHAADGRRLLVLHGDIFDAVALTMPWLAGLGDRAYSLALALNSSGNWLRRKLGLKYKSYSSFMKQNIKRAVNYINSFEEMIARHTRECECEGVICGHIHTPAIKTEGGLAYYNCGDWVESCTALLEFEDGSFELVYYHELEPALEVVAA
ncbi:MAG: UDP-2,3-diacylglucosamine diphosphatase [Planctomycetota bacterium]|nr:MAG: UDP-2,3-diacylglucosamine diphosphatase [Planctomycetota bacterium]